MRLIDADALWEALNDLGGCDALDEYSKGWDKAIDAAINCVEKASTVPQWISVEDRLPDDEKPVLAYYHFVPPLMKYMGCLTYFVHDTDPHWQHESTGLTVTHWMPLPAPLERREESCEK